MDLTLNNLQWLICHKTKLKQTKPIRGKEFLPETAANHPEQLASLQPTWCFICHENQFLPKCNGL